MKYNFSEKILLPSFKEDVLNEVLLLIEAGSSCTIIGMPFVGISPFFRFLATSDLAYFAYVDVHALQTRSKEDLYLSLYKELDGKDSNLSRSIALDACKNRLRYLLSKHERIVIIVNRFDYLDKEAFSERIFTHLKSLEDIGKGRVIFLIAVSTPLYEINEQALYDSNLAFISKNVYFTPFVGNDIKKVLQISPVALKPKQKDLKKALNLSAGHSTLLQLLLKTEYLDSPIEDPFIRLHLKVIYESINTKQQMQVRKLSIGKTVANIDPFLLKIGLVKKIGKQYEVFSPLLRQYIIAFSRMKFSRKEKKLFTLLKKNLDKVVTKDAIFQYVWEEEVDSVTDWALNSLIYRLRKNSTFKNNRYVIENDKNQGYRLLKLG